MVFSSISFLYYFLPIVFLLYFVLPKKIRNFVLLISSLAFYFYGESIYIILMLITIISAYITGLIIEKFNEAEEKAEKDNLNKIRRNKKNVLILEVAISIGILGVFKYADFFIRNINDLFNSKINLLHLTLPIGISFYTFQSMSYVIDVYTKKVKVQKSIIKLALYVTFFPQLIAGPIVRYSDIENQFDDRKLNGKLISEGIKKFIIGLSKKVLLANNLAYICESFQTINDKTVLLYWIYAIANCLYIYLDFSGYSDMAIGLAKMFGFKFPENFNYPYISKSVTEFWRRWHISLGTWFRDYVYIPLGGNRNGKIKHLRNILIVWFLTGMWHGANWNFIIWGLYFGIILIIEKNFLLKKIEKGPGILARIYTLFIVVLSFVIFSADSMKNANFSILSMLGFKNIPLYNEISLYHLKNNFVTFIVSMIASTPVLKLINEKIGEKKLNIIYKLEPVILGGLLIICTGYLVDNSFNPFLYFRF